MRPSYLYNGNLYTHWIRRLLYTETAPWRCLDLPGNWAIISSYYVVCRVAGYYLNQHCWWRKFDDQMSVHPADTWRNNNVVITSKRRRNVVLA